MKVMFDRGNTIRMVDATSASVRLEEKADGFWRLWIEDGNKSVEVFFASENLRASLGSSSKVAVYDSSPTDPSHGGKKWKE